MDIFSNLQVMGECLLDKKRVKAFNDAINEVVKPGDTVIDCGTGSGIMAMMSARAGALKVHAIEIAEDVAKFARQNIRANHLNKIVEVHNTDVKDLRLGGKVDVVVAEMLDTGLVSEQQAQAMNRLHDLNIVTAETKFIPYGVDCAVEAVEYDFNFYGFHMPFVIQARNFGVHEHIKKSLSSTITYRKVDFRNKVDTSVSEIFEIEFKEDGAFNGLLLKTKTLLSPKVQIWATSDMNMPVVIPVDPMLVKKKDRIKVKIEYEMGEGFKDFRATII